MSNQIEITKAAQSRLQSSKWDIEVSLSKLLLEMNCLEKDCPAWKQLDIVRNRLASAIEALDNVIR